MPPPGSNLNPVMTSGFVFEMHCCNLDLSKVPAEFICKTCCNSEDSSFFILYLLLNSLTNSFLTSVGSLHSVQVHRVTFWGCFVFTQYSPCNPLFKVYSEPVMHSSLPAFYLLISKYTLNRKSSQLILTRRALISFNNCNFWVGNCALNLHLF